MDAPFFCPVADDKFDVPVEDCECRSHTALEGIRDGWSAFCMGKTTLNRLMVKTAEHTNGYILCIHNPMLETNKHVTGLYYINKNDVRMLHGLFHEAIATRGFVKDD